jgi:hypothetical protein
LQAYPGRPASLYPPTAFVDAIDERIEMVGPVRRRRIPTLDLVVVHGLFDSADAVDAADGFVDGFLEYTLDRAHAAGVNTLFAITATKDEPGYVPVWLSSDRQRAYYATVFSLEGLSLD